MGTTDLDAYANRVDSQIDQDNLLGRLVWYSLSEMRVPHADFLKMLEEAGIGATPPRKPSDADVFRRVCSNVKRQRIPTKDPDVFENYRMVEFKDSYTITRRVVRERVNNAGRKLGFVEVLDITFNRDTSDLVFKLLVPPRVAGAVVKEIETEVTDTYYEWRGCLNAQAIREWMRNHLMGIGATMVRPGGGVYFVREAHLPVVEGYEAIGDVLNDMRTEIDHGRVEFHSLPLIDDRKQREMVQRAYEAETVDAVDRLLVEITKLSKSGKDISSDRYTALLDEYQSLMARTTDYEDLLQEKLDSTSKRLEIFSASLLNLRKQVKVDAP